MQSCGPPGIEFETNVLEAHKSEVMNSGKEEYYILL